MYLRQQWILIANKDILIVLFSPGYPFTTPIFFLHRAAAPRSVSLFLLTAKNSIVLYYLSKEVRITLC